MKNVFTVRSIAQKALFDKEIKGQLSDGQWENCRPLNHWKPWSNAEVTVAAEGAPVGRNFAARDKYDLTVLAGNDVVRGRMITAVKLVLTFGEQMYPLVSKLFDVDGSWRGYPRQRANPTNDQDTLDVQLHELFPTQERLENVRTMADMQRYTKSDLLADLKDLKSAMKLRLDHYYQDRPSLKPSV